MNIIHFIEFALAVVFMKIFTNLIIGGFVGAIIGFLIGSAIVYGIHFLIVYIGRSIINSIKHWTLITFRYKKHFHGDFYQNFNDQPVRQNLNQCFGHICDLLIAEAFKSVS